MSQATISPELGSSTNAAESMKLMQDQAVDAAEQSLRKMRGYAENNPLITASIAFAAGMLLSALVRR
jgi:ElaB/YqjD/DUF883 family membrane-anchored ribosome-binding protein